MRKLLLIALAFLILPVFTAESFAASEVFQVEINKGRMIRLDRTAASVMVADPQVADIQVVSPRLIYVHAKSVGDTSLFAIDNNDYTILDATIEVTHNISKLNRAMKRLMPNADISFETVDRGLVMNGHVDSPAESESIRSLASTFLGDNDELVNMVSTAGSDQVTLMVKIAEVSRNELKRFGINLAAAFNPGNFAFNLLQGRAFGSIAGLATSGNDSALGLGYTSGNLSLNSVLDALETQGLVSVLAEPSLTTASGKPASFLAGGEFPIPLVDSQGRITVEYKPFGIGLDFTPVVLSKDKISLTVKPEVSSISTIDQLSLDNEISFDIPSIQTRRAETTVELGSGQTFAIAGLLKNDRSNNIEKFPGLGDMPVLGALFRSHEWQNDQTELVILVTPYVVRPVDDRKKMQSPLDGYTPPSDLERILLGKLYSEHASAEGEASPVHLKPENAPKLHGQGGFILE